LKCSVQISELEAIAVCRCAGRIESARDASHLTQTMQPALESGKNVVLDLSGVAALDSVGILELVLIHMRARAAGCDVSIAGAPNWLQDMLRMSNVAALFEIHQTVQEAISSLSRQVA